MLFFIGAITVLACVLGGFAAMGGHLFVLWQSFRPAFWAFTNASS